jgi:formylmethanofuran dehydrogenase subunit E
MTEKDHTNRNWEVSYDAEPVRVRDPVAEALAVLEPGEPFVFEYADVVKQAGHSCPTAAGSFRVVQRGLDELYPDEHPVRGEIVVRVAEPKDDAAYGVMSRIVSYLTGAAEEDGFGGLAGGYGGRRNLMEFDAVDEGDGPTFVFERTDTGDAVEVVYHVSEVPEAGPGVEHLEKLVDGTATDEEREEFRRDWHDRVRTALTDDSLFETRYVEGTGE